MTYAAYIAESRRTRGIRWAGAAVLVIGLHAGGALALLHMREDDSTDAAGAIAIELAPVTAAPAFTSADIAPGPLMQEEARAPEARRETKETVAEETPLLEPAPLAPSLQCSCRSRSPIRTKSLKRRWMRKSLMRRTPGKRMPRQ